MEVQFTIDRFVDLPEIVPIIVRRRLNYVTKSEHNERDDYLHTCHVYCAELAKLEAILASSF